MFGKKKAIDTYDERGFPARIKELEAQMDEKKLWNDQPRPQQYQRPPTTPPHSDLPSLFQAGSIPAPTMYAPEIRWCIYGLCAVYGTGLAALSFYSISR